MTHDTRQNQLPVEQISISTTQPGPEHSLETREDDPDNATIVIADKPLSDYETLPLRWLWPGRIPYRKLTILDGEPGLGKSLFTLDLAARVTTGQPMPDGSPGIQGNVVLIASEDAVSEVIKPRIEAAGGDPSRVHLIPFVRISNPSTGSEHFSPFTLPTHFPILTTTIKKTRAALVIIDPLMAVLASGIKGLQDPRCRNVLNKLVKLSQENNCALIIVHRHAGPGNPLLYSSGGPLSYIAAYRTGLLVAQHPSDEDIRILATTKNNFSAKACNLIYRIVSNASGIPIIRWLGANYTPTASLLKDSTHHLRYSPERQALLETLRTSSVPLSPKELATKTCQNHTLVKQMLRRMFRADEILYPTYGLYTSHDLPLIEAPISENTTIIPTTLATTDPELDLPITPHTPATLTTLTTPAIEPELDLPMTSHTPATLATLATLATDPDSNQPITSHTPATLATLATLATDPDPNQPMTSHTPATLTTLATLATDPDPNQPMTPHTPATLTTLATLNHPDSNLALPPTTLITPPTPSASPIPIHEETSTPPASFETAIENLRNLLRCSYTVHHLHWIFSTNKAGCPICDTWINNDINLPPDMRTLYDTLAQHPSHPGESNPTWLHRIIPLFP